MIYANQLDKQTGEISKRSSEYDVNQSYTHTYLVISDNTDSPKYIYENAKSNGLPVYGDKLDGVPVSRISIDRREEDNAKAVPSYGLPPKSIGSYAIWNYEVEYSNAEDSGGGSFSTETAPWKLGRATNCSISPKTYTQYTNLGCTDPDKYDDGKVVIRNAAGDAVFREIEVRNYVLSFDYAVKDFRIEYIREYMNTVNLSATVVAGVSIPNGDAVITNLTCSTAEWKGDVYNNVHVEIELTGDKPVWYEEIVGTGYRAKSEFADLDDVAYPIQEFTGTALEFSKLDDHSVVWLDKKRGLGSFGSATINGQSIMGMYQNVSERKVLDKNGKIYQIGSDEQINLKDPNLNLIKIYDRNQVSWKALGFPKKGF